MKSPVALFSLSAFLLTASPGYTDPLGRAQLKETDFYPTDSFPLKRDRNYVFCDTMLEAWEEFVDFNVWSDNVKPLQFAGNKLWSTSLNGMLQTHPIVKDPSRRFSHAGFGQKAVEFINEELRRRKESPLNLSSIKDDDIVAYSFLSQVLQFGTKFSKVKPIEFGRNRTKVAAFGISTFNPEDEAQRKMAEQVVVYGDSIVDLTPNSNSGDVITLAKINPLGSLKDLIEAVLTKKSQVKKAGLDPVASIKIPVIDFDVKWNYEEMKKHIEGTEYQITEAFQNIRFVLNDEGSKLKSDAVIAASRGMGPRNFIFSDSFLVMLSRPAPDGQPSVYFAAYIANDELLTKVGPASLSNNSATKLPCDKTNLFECLESDGKKPVQSMTIPVEGGAFRFTVDEAARTLLAKNGIELRMKDEFPSLSAINTFNALLWDATFKLENQSELCKVEFRTEDGLIKLVVTDVFQDGHQDVTMLAIEGQKRPVVQAN